MKKLLTFTAAAFLMTSPAMAEHEAGGDAPHHKGGKMFERADADGDGVVTKDEFLAEQTKRFDEMDADKDGKVTKDEAKAKMEEMRKKWDKKKHDGEEGKAPEAPPADAPVDAVPPVTETPPVQ